MPDLGWMDKAYYWWKDNQRLCRFWFLL